MHVPMHFDWKEKKESEREREKKKLYTYPEGRSPEAGSSCNAREVEPQFLEESAISG